MALPASAAAQDFGVMNSAETINRGNFKLLVNPMVIFGRNGADTETGIAGAFGYGFTDRFDAEAKLAAYDGIKLFGIDAEYWLVKDKSVDVSMIGGVHFGRPEFGTDSKALDFTFLASKEVAPKLELFGALDLARTWFDDSDFDFSTVHLVPGIEYRISDKLDFVGELGLGLNDNSSHYLTAGLAIYFGTRR
jgi:hypothetical protein